MESKTLDEITDLSDVVIDGEHAGSLDPTGVQRHATCDSIAKEAGVSLEAPKYSGMHQHCQYMRTC